jgi:pimeloyl-ACP methyl ester carboxylesterase
MKISRSRLLLVAAFAAAVLSAGAMPLPTGYDQMDVGNYTNAVTVYTYKPRSYSNGPLLIVMHGMLRDAELYCSHAVPLADRYHLLVAAPYFDTNRFPPAAYNLGGVVRHQTLQPRESWTYQWILETVKAIREREGNPALPYYLIGHSAGAQFVMRYAAFMPPGAERIVAANPGSDLFPRTDWKFGYGFGGLPPELGDEAALQRYLAAPLTL